MDTSTAEIAVEPDGELHSSLLPNRDNFSFNETLGGSEKCNQPAPCGGSLEFNEDPYTCTSGDFLAPFTLSDPSGSSNLNDINVQETDSLRHVNSFSEISGLVDTENALVYDYSEFSDHIQPVEHVECVLTSNQEVKTEVKDNTKCEISPKPCVLKLETASEEGRNLSGTSRGSSAESSSSKDVDIVLKTELEVKMEVEDVTECEISSEPLTKFESLSEDENNFDAGKSSSSKDGSPSEPSCSGTSRTGLHSLTSDSEDELPPVNITLPFKKRKREKLVEILSSSSCSEDESQTDIDYANLTPEQIKALIEQAKRYGRVKRKCKCPKKKWSELPIVGPIEGSKNCTVGKGDWSERVPEPCLACSGGTCDETHHKRGRHSRKRPSATRSVLSKSRARGTIGVDVPIIELSDSEEVTPVPTSVVSEVTISAVPPGECIVLSSSEDDDIVCERVIQTEVKVQVTESEAGGKHPKPDVIVLNSSTTVHSSFTSFTPPPYPQSLTAFPSLSTPPPCPSGPLLNTPTVSLSQDSETWPDLSVDLESWDETMNLLANICGPAATGNNSRAIPTPPERPPTPEVWSCPICLESKTAVNEIMSTTCGHVFCGNCIRSSVRIHKKCPTCRKKLTMKQFHKIFL
ncbi:E3 ubiquitin-protein ligase RNF4 [Frankliniella fusca]|uniref:E3 ubiquitin-protein ligase RNF4 n=1 Tax=Frankliniella fusca TaxID=407009 RepID=A0AAE1I5N1_9NEOP|nr:E3 ubiquitin-protein ligase RNF4 [Frankliniella fusca]